MKFLLSVFLLLAAPQISFAMDVVEPVTPPEFSEQDPTSATTCYAYTSCYDYYGRVIGQVNCQVYGYQYVNERGGSASNYCSWYVRGGVGVRCSGYQQQYNYRTGRYYWAWNTVSASCPGY